MMLILVLRLYRCIPTPLFEQLLPIICPLLAFISLIPAPAELYNVQFSILKYKIVQKSQMHILSNL